MSTGKRPPRRSPSVAAGAARAAGERSRRHTTPLLGVDAVTTDSAPESVTPDQRPLPRAQAARRRNADPERSADVAASTGHPSAIRPANAPTDRPTPDRPTPDPSKPDLSNPDRPPRSQAARPRLQVVRDGHIPERPDTMPALTELADAIASAVTWVAGRFGVDTDTAQAQVAETVAFIRRRVDGDFTVDDFGFDPDYAEHVFYPLLRPLQRSWFRTEVRGLEHIPASGGALLVANHSGTIPLDALMTQLAIHDGHPQHRHLRGLGADLVFSTPFVGEAARRGGSTLATTADAERLLAAGELVGVWPEGFKGTGKPFRERYRLQRFGRGGFVSTALKAGVPIIPCAIVGAEEAYPLLANAKPLARLFGLPYVPITPTFPLLGPLGLIPLPSKWLIEFCPPIETASLGGGSADDPAVVFDLTDRVRETIQQTIYSLLVQRRSAFH